jgi:hypothetical protein
MFDRVAVTAPSHSWIRSNSTAATPQPRNSRLSSSRADDLWAISRRRRNGWLSSHPRMKPALRRCPLGHERESAVRLLAVIERSASASASPASSVLPLLTNESQVDGVLRAIRPPDHRARARQRSAGAPRGRLVAHPRVRHARTPGAAVCSAG